MQHVLIATSILLALAATPVAKVTTISYGQTTVETTPLVDMRYTAGVLTYSKPGAGIFRNGFE